MNRLPPHTAKNPAVRLLSARLENPARDLAAQRDVLQHVSFAFLVSNCTKKRKYDGVKENKTRANDKKFWKQENITQKKPESTILKSASHWRMSTHTDHRAALKRDFMHDPIEK